MSKIRRFLPKNPLFYAVAAPVLLTAAILFFTCAVFGLFPFGDGSLCWCDMRQQGLPLLMMLRNALLSGDSLTYTPGLTGGADFSGVAAFFLWNPGSLLSVFWKAKDLLDLLNLLVFGKLLLCAATAGWFFYRRFPKNGIGFSTAFSVTYALCGYGLLYFQNLMWLDVMALFPLFLLACYALLERGRPLPYVILMALCMATCFYLGFMVALFALLFFGVHLWMFHAHRRRTAVQFLLGSLLAALLSAFVWLPAFGQVIHSARSTYLSDSLSTCSWGAPLTTSLPLLLCSATIPALLLVTVLLFPKWSKKAGALAILCGLMLIPMFLEPVNRMWHMGSYMCFPCRFGFIPIFLLLTLVAQLWSRDPVISCKNRVSRKVFNLLGGGVVIAVGIYLQRLFAHESETAARYVRTLWGDTNSLCVHLFAFAAVMLAAGLLAFLYRARFIKKPVAAVLLCALIACESTFYTALYIGKVPTYWQFNTFDAIVDLADKTDPDSFARVKTESDFLDSNMVGALGYPSFGGYTSLVTEDTLYTAKKLGYSASWMDIGLNGGTRFSDALLSMGYTIDRVSSRASDNPIVYVNDTFRLESLSDTFPLGLLVNGNAAIGETLPDGDRLSIQEQLAETLFGETNLFTRYVHDYAEDCTFTPADGGATCTITGTAPAIVYSVYADGAMTLYLDCFDGYSTRVNEPIFNSFSVAVNGVTVCGSYPSGYDSGFLDLGDYQNETVVITLTPLKSGTYSSFGVFGLHRETLSRLVTAAPTAGLTYNGHAYVGSFVAGENQRLLLTLPYANGYTAIVNGHRRPIQRTMDNFFSLALSPGETAVKITYTPPGLVAGWILSLVGAALLALALVFRRRIDSALSSHEALVKYGNKAAFILAVSTSVLCVFAVYLFPVVYKLLSS